MTTLHKTDKGILVITKGAVDVLLGKLNRNQESLIPEFEYKANKMAERGYRVLGYAIRTLSKLPKTLSEKQTEKNLTFIGFVGMIDPPREEAKQAVKEWSMKAALV
jgi:Ca2+-transporting ATPase